MPLYCYEHITDFVFHSSFLMHLTHHKCRIVLWVGLRYTCKDYQDQRETQLTHLPAILTHLPAIKPDDQQQRWATFCAWGWNQWK